jgi:hypothetical protein
VYRKAEVDLQLSLRKNARSTQALLVLGSLYYAPTGLPVQITPAPRRVLDLGCFCGGTGRWLEQGFPGCQVVGIEMLAEAAALTELDGLTISGLSNRDLLELAALQLYLRATPR